jgi:hypothetical protein
MNEAIQRACEQPSTEAWLEIGQSLLAEGEPDERQCRDVVAALSKWPETPRWVDARIEDESDPWWRYGQLPGSLDFVRLARVLTIDTRPWIELASDSRWRSGGGSELRELDLRHVDKVDDIITVTTALPCLSRLELGEARLVWRELDVGELARVLEELPAPLTQLGVRGILLGESGARMLNRSPALLTLRSLDLSLTDLGDRGASALADWPHSNLRTLSLRGCKLRRGPLAWRGRPLLTEIENLDLSLNHLSATAFAAVIDSAPKLRALTVANSQLAPELLGRATHSCLRELDISHSVGGDWFFEVLLTAIAPSLITLIARDCDITDESLPSLLGALGRLGLEHVDLRDNQLSDAARTAIREAGGAGRTILL